MGAGCEKEDTLSICGVNDPLNNLDWLKELKVDLEKDVDVSSAEIILYHWNNKDYIYVQKTISSGHDFPNAIYDCEGNEKFTCGGNQPVNYCSTFFLEAQKIIILWGK